MEMKDEMGNEFDGNIVKAFKDYYKGFQEHLAALKTDVFTAIQRDHDLIGRVLKCHLIIESSLDSCINYLNADKLAINKTSLRFIQKVQILEEKLDEINSYFKGIRCLNTIRNKFAHNLHYQVVLADVQPMKPYVEVYKQKKIDDPILIIEEFTIVAYALLKNETVEQYAGLSKLYTALVKNLADTPEEYDNFFEECKTWE